MAEVWHETSSLPGLGRSALPRISLRAIFAGVVVALISQVVLLVLGGAIGLSVFQADVDDPTLAQGIGVGAAIWLILSLAVSAFFGAWISAVVSRTSLKRDGILSGIVMWSTVALVGLFLVSSTVAGTLGGISRVAGDTARIAEPALPAMPSSEEARQVAEQARQAAQDPQLQRQAARGAAMGFWALFLAHVIPLGTAILGGALGARSERRQLLVPSTTVTHRDDVVSTPPPTVPQPT